MSDPKDTEDVLDVGSASPTKRFAPAPEPEFAGIVTKLTEANLLSLQRALDALERAEQAETRAADLEAENRELRRLSTQTAIAASPPSTEPARARGAVDQRGLEVYGYSSAQHERLPVRGADEEPAAYVARIEHAMDQHLVHCRDCTANRPCKIEHNASTSPSSRHHSCNCAWSTPVGFGALLRSLYDVRSTIAAYTRDEIVKEWPITSNTMPPRLVATQVLDNYRIAGELMIGLRMTIEVERYEAHAETSRQVAELELAARATPPDEPRAVTHVPVPTLDECTALISLRDELLIDDYGYWCDDTAVTYIERVTGVAPVAPDQIEALRQAVNGLHPREHEMPGVPLIDRRAPASVSRLRPMPGHLVIRRGGSHIALGGEAKTDSIGVNVRGDECAEFATIDSVGDVVGPVIREAHQRGASIAWRGLPLMEILQQIAGVNESFAIIHADQVIGVVPSEEL